MPPVRTTTPSRDDAPVDGRDGGQGPDAPASAPDAASATRDRRRRALGLAGLVALFAVPLGVALTALAHPQWIPLGDLAQTELRVRDVGSSDAPLIGLAGRIGVLGQQGSHPGPLSFFALWPFYQLFGASSWAMQAASASLHLVAIATALWIAFRRGGIGLALGLAAVLALLVRAYGATTITEAWNPHLPVMWWIVFVLAVWSVLCRDLPMFPVAVFAGSFCAQTHVPYLALVAGLGAVAVGALVVTARAGRREHGLVRAAVRWGLVGLALAAVLWAPPVIDEIRNEPGNLTLLWETFSDPPETPVGFGEGVDQLFVHLNPWTLVVDQVAASGTAIPSDSPVPGALVLGVWVAAVAVAWRLRHAALLRLHGVLGASLLLGVLAMSRIHGKIWYYLLLWGWGITALMLLAVGWTAAAWLGRRPPRLASSAGDGALAQRAGRLTLAGVTVVLTLLFAVDATDVEVPAANNSATMLRLMPDTVEALADPSGPGGGRDGRYLVTWTDPVYIGTQAYALLDELEREGFDVGVVPVHAGGATPHRVLLPEDADAEVHLAVGPPVEEWQDRPGADEVAYFDPRSREERAEFDRLRLEVVGELRRLGLGEQADNVDDNLFTTAIDPAVPDQVRDKMTRMLDLGVPTAVFVGEPRPDA